MRILLIRHGLTAGNKEKRYIGRTDEPLCPEGLAALGQCSYPCCAALVSSPMQRCRQTAQILFPAQKIHICEALRECDFGDFEGKIIRNSTAVRSIRRGSTAAAKCRSRMGSLRRISACAAVTDSGRSQRITPMQKASLLSFTAERSCQS